MRQEGWNIFISEKASREKKKDKTKQKQDRKTSDKKRKKGGKKELLTEPQLHTDPFWLTEVLHAQIQPFGRNDKCCFSSVSWKSIKKPRPHKTP